jgi:hypothetical protein
MTKAKSKKTVKKLPPDPRVGTMALWIETPFGPLYPCVRPPATVAEGDTQTLQVRARRREYLDHFRARWCPEAGEVLTGEQVTGHKTPCAVSRRSRRGLRPQFPVGSVPGCNDECHPGCGPTGFK